jgi:hypothetical protein
LQRADGHIAYSSTSDQTPVWVTAQALTALRRKPFPLATVRRERRRGVRASVAGNGGAAVAPSAADAPGGGGQTPEGAGGAGGKGSEEGAGAGGAETDPRRGEAADEVGSLLPPGSAANARAEPLQTEAAADRSAGDGGAPALWVWLVAAAGVLVLLWLLRRRLGLDRLSLRRTERASDP